MRKEKAMRLNVSIAAGFLVAIMTTPAVIAQHEGHRMPGAAAGAGGACAEHAREGLQIVDRINRRLEESRQTNNPARMRAAMDDLQQALAELKTHQLLCVSAVATEAKSSETAKPGSSPGMETMDRSKMGHSMSPPASPTPNGTGAMDHSKMNEMDTASSKGPAQPSKTPTPRKPDGQ
ncbi:MAG: hypothetical protein ACRD1P_01585 [Thermoanaerobaculia bacterium]